MAEEVIIKTPIGNITLYNDNDEYSHLLYFRSDYLLGSKSFTGYKSNFEIVHGTSIISNVSCDDYPGINSVTFMIDGSGKLVIDIYNNNIDTSYFEEKITKEKRKVEQYANRSKRKQKPSDSYEVQAIDDIKEFYVYEHYIKNTNYIFYVGKGTGDRYMKIERNNACNRVWNNNECSVRIVKDNMTEREALDFEHDRIKELAKKGYVLTNIVD